MGVGGNVNYYKSVHHSIPTRGSREYPGNFQVYSLLAQTKVESKAFFEVCKKRDRIMRLPPQEYLVLIRDEI